MCGVRPLFLVLATAVALSFGCPNDKAGFAKDQAGVPSSVFRELRKLADESRTFRIRPSEEGWPAEFAPRDMVFTQLDGRYAKVEMLNDPAVPTEDLISIDNTQFFSEAYLFDGRERFYLGRDNRDRPFSLRSVGAKSSVILQSIAPTSGMKSFPVAGDIFLDQIPNKSDVHITRFEQDESGIARMEIMFDSPEKHQQLRRVQLTLDSNFSYRPLEILSHHDTLEGPRRTLAEHSYGDRLYPASKIITYYQRPDPSQPSDWLNYRTITRRIEFLPTEGLTSKAFSIEHYGLPPYQYPSTPLWYYLAAATLGFLSVAWGIWLFRRNQ